MPEEKKTAGTAQPGPEATSEKGANTENPATEARQPQTEKKYTEDDVFQFLIGSLEAVPGNP